MFVQVTNIKTFTTSRERGGWRKELHRPPHAGSRPGLIPEAWPTHGSGVTGDIRKQVESRHSGGGEGRATGIPGGK